MSNYQAVYDAAFQAFDISYVKALAQEQIAVVGYEMSRPSAVYRPKLSVDGNMWCALYGDDLMNGIAGFGETVEQAMADFDKNWQGQKLLKEQK